MGDQLAFLTAGGETGGMIATRDWSATPLGPVQRWPQSLRTALGLLLRSPVPIVLLWGEQGVMLYNDAYSAFAGGRHPRLLGSKVREGWPEVADFNDHVMRVGLAGGTLAYRDQELTLHRHGRPEQVWMNLDYSPVPDESGRPAGVLAIVVETTERVLAERRQAFLLRLEESLRGLTDPNAVTLAAAEALGRHIGAARSGYAELDAAGRMLHVAHDWTDGRLPRRTGETRELDAFGAAAAAELRRGRVVIIEDCLTDPRTGSEAVAATWASIGIRALVVAPLIKVGTLAAFFYAHDTQPRGWSAAEAELVHDVAERTWSAVERARAEMELRESETRLRLAQDAAGMGSWEWNVATGALFWSESCHRLHGTDPTVPPSYEGWLAGMHEGDRDRVVEVLETALQSGRADWSVEFRYRRGSDAALRWIIGRGTITREEGTGRPLRVLGIGLDITDLRRAEEELRESEGRLRLAVEAGQLSAWAYDFRGDLGVREGPLAAATPVLPSRGFSLAEWLAPIHPEDRPEVERRLWATARGDTDRFAADFRLRRPVREGWIWLSSFGAVVERDPATGEPLRMAGVARDITARKRDEARQALLMREVDHRAKNALSVVQAALRLTRAPDVASYVRAVEGRVAALARAQTLLAEDRWTGADLEGLLRGEMNAFIGTGTDGPQARLEGPPVTVPARAAQPITMALHELATNAVKHGALSVPGGRVVVVWHVAGSPPARLRIRWTEEGGPRVEGSPRRLGFGTRVLEGTVREQLSGALSLAWKPTGLVCDIEVPLGAGTAGGEP